MKLKIMTVLMCIWSSIVFADVAVVVHPSNANSLDANEINRIFTGKSKSFPDGAKAIPINQAESSGTAQEFNKKVLNRSGSQLKAYWSKLVFTGKGTPPKEVSNDQEVLEIIASNPNLIGYVDAGSVSGNVKVVATF